MNNTILIVDDEPVQLRLLEVALERMGHSVVKAENGTAALKILRDENRQVHAVVLDLVMPETDGMGVLEALREEGEDVPVIVQTANGGIDTVVAAMRCGAFDFLVKPASPQKLESAIANALRFAQHATKKQRNEPKEANSTGLKDIVTQSTAMRPVLKMAEKAAASAIPVLIEGESGVGKEMIAKAIHGMSDRAAKPFITVNCGALPENLVESILFGHEKGAFTGAVEKHRGKFEEADGGTLFLDEIGELPSDLQVKLLRAIQEKEIDPIGARRPVKIDIRLISATNRRLDEEVRKQRFREDLFYRLSVLPLSLPPLRERKEDVLPLSFHFAQKVARQEKRNDICAIRPEVLDMLAAYHWPGNVRELENAIFRAVVLCEGDELTIEDFPQIASQMPDFELPQTASTGDPRDSFAGSTQAFKGILITTPEPGDPITRMYGDARGLPASQASSGTRNTVPPTSGYGLLNMISSKGGVRELSSLEEEAIRFAIQVYNGRMSEVARRLGIGRSTLYRKLKEYDIGDVGSDETVEND